MVSGKFCLFLTVSSKVLASVLLALHIFYVFRDFFSTLTAK